MATRRIRELRNVWGPTQDKRGRWQVITEGLTGRRHTKHFATEAQACEYVVDCEKKIEETKEGIHRARDYPDFDGKLSWFLNLMAHMTKEAYTTGDKDLRQLLGVIAKVAQSAKHLFDTTDLEERIEEIEARQVSILNRARHGTRTEGTPRRGSQEIQSEESLC
jgi:hypothetical protein